MIEIENISKCFGKLQVLRQINLHFAKGQSIALIGPNGCGKTTLIKSILGMVIPTEGNIKFDGQSIQKNYAYRSQIGYMPQIGRYPDNMTIGQIMEMMKEIRKSKQNLDEELLYQFDLESLFSKKMHTLSGGTTQKVSATLAFLFNPDVLILDEPTAGLDPLAAEILKEKIIKEKQKGKLVLITSHLLSELDELISQVVMMQEGQIQLHKDIDDLKDITGTNTISRAITHILKANQKGFSDTKDLLFKAGLPVEASIRTNVNVGI